MADGKAWSFFRRSRKNRKFFENRAKFIDFFFGICYTVLAFRRDRQFLYADVVKLADTPDLGSGAYACRFKSCHPHQTVQFPLREQIFRGVAQLVARLVRDQEVVGSNPVTPTRRLKRESLSGLFLYPKIETMGSEF